MPGDPSVTYTVSGQSTFFECMLQPAANEAGSVQYGITWSSGSAVVLSRKTITTSVDRLTLSELDQSQRSSIIASGVTYTI